MSADAFQAVQAIAAATSSQPVSITVQLPNLPLWATDAARQVIQDLTRHTMHLALSVAAGRISDAAPRNTGHLAQSFGTDPAGPDGGITLQGATFDTGGMFGRVFSSLPYAIVMDQGRRAGAPISQEGIDAIGLWAQRKLGLSAEEAERAKWAIAMGIVAQGIQGTDFVNTGVDASRGDIQSLFDTLGASIAAGLAGN